MRSGTITSIAALLCLISANVGAAPPPPLPPNTPDLPKMLTDAMNNGDLTGYSTLFADDVRVYEGATEIAHGKPAFMDLAGKWMAAGFQVTPLSVAEGGEILIMERVSNLGGPVDPRVVRDCCWWTRAARYTIGDNRKIVEVHFLTAMRASNIRCRPDSRPQYGGLC